MLRGRGTAVDEVLDWLLDFIHRENLSVGSLLPPEAEISKQTGISRNSVREATSYLRALGIVESRPRVGMRLVRDPALIGLQRLLTCKKIPDRFFREVSVFRDALEFGIAGEVCANITDEEIDQLEEILRRIESNPEDLPLQLALDREFHTIFLHSARNMIVSSMSHILEPLFSTKEEHSDYRADSPLV